MPEFRDDDGVKWRVRRAQWPLLGAMDIASWGASTFGVIMFVIALPVLLAWPFWLLAKFCGMPWKVVTERDGDEVTTEKVKGWGASGRRIAEIVAEKKAATAAIEQVGFEQVGFGQVGFGQAGFGQAGFEQADVEHEGGVVELRHSGGTEA